MLKKARSHIITQPSPDSDSDTPSNVLKGAELIKKHSSLNWVTRLCMRACNPKYNNETMHSLNMMGMDYVFDILEHIDEQEFIEERWRVHHKREADIQRMSK